MTRGEHYAHSVLVINRIENGCELLGNSLEHFFDGSWVSYEGWVHLESLL